MNDFEAVGAALRAHYTPMGVEEIRRGSHAARPNPFPLRASVPERVACFRPSALHAGCAYPSWSAYGGLHWLILRAPL